MGTLIYIDDPLKRDFYLEICRLEYWSVRQLQESINPLLYERTAISKKPENTIREDYSPHLYSNALMSATLCCQPLFAILGALKEYNFSNNVYNLVIMEWLISLMNIQFNSLQI